MKKNSLIKNLKQKFRLKKLEKKCSKISHELKNILSKDYINDIPVILICYNNGVYVKNLVTRLNELKCKPIVIDNNSNDEKTISLLKSISMNNLAEVIFSNYNLGHQVGFLEPIYNILPDIFAYSDPDLELSSSLPDDFLDVLKKLTDKYKVYKVGFALDLLKAEERIENKTKCIRKYPFVFEREYSIDEWEDQFWTRKLNNDSYELYSADIDTTFCVCNKKQFKGNFFEAIRVAGEFSAIHLPWFPVIDLMSKNEKEIYLKNNKSTTWM